MARYSVVSLFSGAGGLDWGFRELGFEIVFANDVSPTPMRTYSRNFGLKLTWCGPGGHVATPGEALVCDVSQVDFSGLENLNVDVVVGGPPCQDFTILRNGRAGIRVSRGRLYVHFVRALAQLQPRVFVFENVPGLKSVNNGLAYKTIVGDFEKLNLRYSEIWKQASYNRVAQGYRVVFSDVVDFSELGVPQRRKRLVVIGVRKDLVKQPDEISRLVSRLLYPRSIFAKCPLTPLEVFEGRALPELQNEYTGIMVKWSGVWDDVGTDRALEWKVKVWGKLTFDVVKDYLLVNGVKVCNEHELEETWREHEKVLRELGYYGRRVCESPPPDGTCTLPEEDAVVRERLKRIPPGENHEFARGTAWSVKGHVSQYYRRLHPLKPSYTVIARGGGGTYGYHYDRDRATLSLREKARLQTFPDNFLFTGTRTEIRAQIGEAVPPLAGRRVAEVVVRTLELLGP